MIENRPTDGESKIQKPLQNTNFKTKRNVYKSIEYNKLYRFLSNNLEVQ